MNREVRTVRPFQVPYHLARVFEGAVFRFGRDECYPDGRINIDIDDYPDEYGRRPAELIWASDSELEYFKAMLNEGAQAAEIDPACLALLITVSTSYLKITEVVFRHPLMNLEGLTNTVNLSGPPRPSALRTGFHGATIVAYLLLTEEIKPCPLRPWRKGTWLARAAFKLVPRSRASLFRPSALDDEQRNRLGLPKGVVRYLDMSDHEPLLPYEDSYPPIFYVDQELLASLASRPRAPISRSIQVQLVQDFIYGVLTSPAVQEADLGEMIWTDMKDTLLGRVLNLIAGPDASEERLGILVQLIRDDPAKLVAQAEHAIGLRKVLLATSREGQI